MKIAVLSENTAYQPNSNNIKPEHGLSLYIETYGHKILYDTGSSDIFVENARKMSINLSDVDVLIISHGHIDHGGGIEHFFKVNTKAKVLMHKKAIQPFYTKILGLFPFYIGLPLNVIKKNSNRISFIESNFNFTDYIRIISGFDNQFPLPQSNKSLFEKQNKQLQNDTFEHELLLLINEGNKNYVFTACSHSGIINMVDEVQCKYPGNTIDYVFGGFHTYNPIKKKNESDAYLQDLSFELLQRNTTFYTGHCTGQRNFNILKEKMGDGLKSLNCGQTLNL